MNVGDKIWLIKSKEIAEIINIEEKWTSFPHGSGTNYKIITIKKNNNKVIVYDTLWEERDYFKTKNNIINNIKYLQNKLIELKNQLENEINDNEKILELFDNQ